MLSINEQVSKLGTAALTEGMLREHIWPLFSRVLGSERHKQEIYLANHSLGRPLDQTAEDVQQALDLWYAELDDVWNEDNWPQLIDNFRASIAQLVGLSDPRAVVPKTSAGQGLRAVLNALPRDTTGAPLNVVTTRGEFDSIDFILKTYASKGLIKIDWVEPTLDTNDVPLYEVDDILMRIDKGTDLVVVSAVFFGTGQILSNLPMVAARAHEVGALVVVDVYHAAGVIPLSMQADAIDFMIGGSYKYARGGPGACWLAIHPRVLASDLSTVDTGWFAKRDPFGFERQEAAEQAGGGDGWLESTPMVLTVAQAAAGLCLTQGIGIHRLREYNLRQQAVLRAALRQHSVPHVEPMHPEDFGAFTLVPSSDARGCAAKLKAKGVNTDARGGFVRFGPDILNSTAELVKAAHIAGSVLGD